MKICVIGGGIFGVTTAFTLGMEKKFDVHLFEKNSDILKSASGSNQYRVHRGYHYPRSKETAQSSVNGEQTFLDVYNDAIMNGKIEHYYCIAKKDSLVTPTEYENFMSNLNKLKVLLLAIFISLSSESIAADQILPAAKPKVDDEIKIKTAQKKERQYWSQENSHCADQHVRRNQEKTESP